MDDVVEYIVRQAAGVAIPFDHYYNNMRVNKVEAASPRDAAPAGSDTTGSYSFGSPSPPRRLDVINRWNGSSVDAGDVDLVVDADGASSCVRQLLLPGVHPEYADYCAWRGIVPEVDMPQHLLDTFSGLFTFFHAPGTQILAAVIPGACGELSPGKRRLN